jgi:hypothetical protein
MELNPDPLPLEAGYIRLRQFDMPSSGKPELGGRERAAVAATPSQNVNPDRQISVQIQFSNSQKHFVVEPSLRAQRSNPWSPQKERWIASLRSQ